MESSKIDFVKYSICVFWDLVNKQTGSPQWLDWLSICFFGIGILLGLFNLLDSRPEMILNETGLFNRMSYGIFDKRQNKGFVKWIYIKDAYYKEFQNYSPQGLSTSKQKFICLSLTKDGIVAINYNLKSHKLSQVFGLSDYNIPLVNLKKFDEQKFIECIKLMSNTDITGRQMLLQSFNN